MRHMDESDLEGSGADESGTKYKSPLDIFALRRLGIGLIWSFRKETNSSDYQRFMLRETTYVLLREEILASETRKITCF